MPSDNAYPSASRQPFAPAGLFNIPGEASLFSSSDYQQFGTQRYPRLFTQAGSSMFSTLNTISLNSLGKGPAGP